MLVIASQHTLRIQLSVPITHLIFSVPMLFDKSIDVERKALAAEPCPHSVGFVQLDFNDDCDGAVTSCLTFMAVAGQRYKFQVGSPAGESLE